MCGGCRKSAGETTPQKSFSGRSDIKGTFPGEKVAVFNYFDFFGPLLFLNAVTGIEKLLINFAS